MAKPPEKRSVVPLLIAVGIVGLFGALVVSDWHGFEHPRPLAEREYCRDNMRQIGNAIVMYCNDDPLGRLPDNLQQLMTAEQSAPQFFVCPSTDDTSARSVGDLTSGGHLSYIYIGAVLTNKSPSDAVVLYEPLSNHGNSGSNVLFADGHVEFIPVPQAAQLAAMAKAGIRPIYWPPHPATQPSTRP